MHSGFPIEAKQFPLFINKKPERGRVSLLYIIKFKAYPPRGFHRFELPELFSRYRRIVAANVQTSFSVMGLIDKQI